MAFYTIDYYDIIDTRQGISLISDYIKSYKNRVQIEIRHINTTDEVVLIQSPISDSFISTSWSNIVSLNRSKKEITINPFLDRNSNNLTKELKEYIDSIPSILRDQKLEKIL